MSLKPVGLQQRLITALVLFALLVALVFLAPAWATIVIVAMAILGGAWEWSAFLHHDRRPVRAAYVLLIALGLVAAWSISANVELFSWLLLGACAWWVIALLWIMLAPQRGGAISAAVAGVCALVPAGVALARLRLEPNGAALLVFVLLIVMAADVGAYFAGHAWGKTKLAPQVSPGKTWEGVIGGFIVSVLVAFVGSRWLGWPTLSIMLLALGAAAFSVVGDLIESLMKRHSGLKDSGRLFPGHGGLLDRLDSLTAGVPLLVLGLLKAGLIGAALAPGFSG
ncbi:MAG: hypothetical protein RLZZ33_487 [Pseudomonadota bacterium]|jgi:phosphatidate cytidylyltransferase